MGIYTYLLMIAWNEDGWEINLHCSFVNTSFEGIEVVKIMSILMNNLTYYITYKIIYFT